MQTLYASFADRAQAEQAAGALLDHGLHNEDISLVSHSQNSGNAGQAKPTLTSAPEGSLTARDVADYGVRGGERSGDSTYAAYGAVGPRIVETGDRAPAGPSGALMNAETGPGFSSALEMNEAAEAADLEEPVDPLETAPYLVDAGTRPEDLGVERTQQGEDLSAKTGITTTTAEDAEAGALEGAGIGLGVGALAVLASLFVPGLGLVLGGGGLATAVGGAVLATGAGAIAGGVTGYLKDQGVPEETARHYAGTVEGGGAVISVHLSEENPSLAEARAILEKYGATNIHTVGAA